MTKKDLENAEKGTPEPPYNQSGTYTREELLVAKELALKGEEAVREAEESGDEVLMTRAQIARTLFLDYEMKLSHSGSRYETLFQASKDAIMTLAPPGWNFESGNQSAIKMFGVEDEADFKSRPPWKYSPEYQPDGVLSSDKAKEMIMKAMENGSNFFEWTHCTVDGEEFQADVLLTRVTVDGKEMLLATVRDVSRRKKSEKEYRHMKEMVDRANFGVTASDLEGNIIYVNKALANIYGYTPEELIGKHVSIFHPKEQLPQLVALIQKLQGGGGAVTTEILSITKDGREISVLLNISLYRNSNGEPMSMFASAIDVSGQKQAEDALMEAKVELQAIFDQEPTPLVVIDSDRRIIKANRAARGNGELSEDDVVGIRSGNLLECIHSASSPDGCGFGLECIDCETRKLVQGVIDSGKPSGVVLTKLELGEKGNERLFLTSAMPLPRGRDKEKKFLVSMQDVTELSEANESIRRSEERYRNLVETSQNLVWQCDAEGRFTYLSPAWEKVVGYSNKEMIGHLFSEFQLDEVIARDRKEFESHLDGGSTTGHETVYLSRDDQEINLIFNAIPIHDKDGNIIGTQGTAMDITELRNATDAIRESEERYRLLFENSPAGIVTVDLEGNVLNINPGLLKIVGVPSEEEALKLNLFKLEALSGTKMLDDFKACIEDGCEITGENPLMTERGRQIYMRYTLTPIRDASGNVIGVQATVEDVTAIKETQLQLHQSQKMEALGTLAGGVAHDMNNVLAVVLGLASVLESNTSLDEQIVEDVKQIKAASLKGRNLVNQLLMFSRKEQLKPVVLDLNHKIKNLLPMIHRLLPESIAIRHDLSENLGCVKVDPSSIEQVLINLSTNARDAMPKGGVLEIHTENVVIDEADLVKYDLSKPGAYTKLTVKDNGCGIPDETIKRIFEPFFTTKEIGKGTGLGLSMVYGTIKKQYEGAVHASSTEGKGTTIEILLPSHQMTEVDQGELRAASLEALKGEGKILVVDDEEMLRNLSLRILDRLGYEVMVAQSGKEALDLVVQGVQKGDPFDLIVSDVVMPEMGGAQLKIELEALGFNIPIIFMSGHTGETMSDHGLSSDEDHFVGKPFEVHEIGKKIKDVLGKK